MNDQVLGRGFRNALVSGGQVHMHELIKAAGVEFIVRSGSVDRENVEWMADSWFISALRATDVGASDTVLDLGCHIGSFAVIAAAEKRCRVVGFEPDPDSLRLARANALLNNVDDLVEVHALAVGAESRPVPLYEATENWGHTIFEGGGPYNVTTGRSRAVQMITLTDALDYVPAAECPFVKFNIEGAEHEMFAATTPESLRRVKILVGEVHYDLGDGDRTGWPAKLAEWGFALQMIPQGHARAILIARRS